jgi:hypothetical protein
VNDSSLALAFVFAQALLQLSMFRQQVPVFAGCASLPLHFIISSREPLLRQSARCNTLNAKRSFAAWRPLAPQALKPQRFAIVFQSRRRLESVLNAQ